MPNSLQSSAIASPASRRATNCSLSSITERSFQGIIPSSLEEESVTHVSGTKCYLCLRPLIQRLSNRAEVLCLSLVHVLVHTCVNNCIRRCPFSLHTDM